MIYYMNDKYNVNIKTRIEPLIIIRDRSVPSKHRAAFQKYFLIRILKNIN